MSSIITFLKGLIGRAKRNMDTFLLAMGGILMPIGFSFMVLGQSSLAFFCIGIIAIVGGFIFWLGAYKEVQTKEAKRKQEREEERGEIRDLLTNIHKEIQKLNEGKK